MKQSQRTPGGEDMDALKQSLEGALRGAVFPLSGRQLIWLARENDAPASLLTLLSALPGGSFPSLPAVEHALGARGEDVPPPVARGPACPTSR